MTRQGLDYLKLRLLADIRRVAWRREDTLARRFGIQTKLVGEYCEDRNVSDALLELVQEGRIEWFGAENDLGAPMRYRVAPRRR